MFNKKCVMVILVCLTVLFISGCYDRDFFMSNSKVEGDIAYAGMYLFNESGVSLSFTQYEWINYTDVICGLNNSVICDSDYGTLTILYPGVYEAHALANGDDGNNQIFELAVAINNIVQNNTKVSDETASGLRTSMNGFGRFYAEAGDVITLQIRCITSDVLGTLYHSNFIIEKVDE